jgi:DNA-directed RNA polymerase specialized sigma24 family protein
MKNANARKTLKFDIQTVQSFRESQDEFDTLVMLASRGDRRAIGAIAAAMGGDILKVARAALKGCEDEAGDVVQDFMLALLEQRWPFNREQGGGLTWMFGIVKMIARNRRRETLRGRGMED